MALKRENDKLRAERRSLLTKIWKLEQSRASWKSKRKPNQKQQRKPRETILNAKQELEFMVSFNITGKERLRMKKFMRKTGVDFFAREREREALMIRLAPREHWSYERVEFFNRDSISTKFLEEPYEWSDV
jgi:hypothetical protein